jgi:hypothetical protein
VTDRRQTRPLVREGASQRQHSNFQTEYNIWSRVPEWTWHQDILTDWPSVVTWLWLWLYLCSSFVGDGIISGRSWIVRLHTGLVRNKGKVGELMLRNLHGVTSVSLKFRAVFRFNYYKNLALCICCCGKIIRLDLVSSFFTHKFSGLAALTWKETATNTGVTCFVLLLCK